MEAREYVWKGAIPLQIHLHESEILASRIGYLPLLIPRVKPHFGGALPPGADTVWFDYNGLPLKWFIVTEVLFDLLCPELKRPRNLTGAFALGWLSGTMMLLPVLFLLGFLRGTTLFLIAG